MATSCRWEDVEGDAERLLESTRANEQESQNRRVSQEQDDDRIVDRDETDPFKADLHYFPTICSHYRSPAGEETLYQT